MKVDLSALSPSQRSALSIPAVCFFINVRDLQAPRVKTPSTVPPDQNADCLGFETVSDLVSPAIASTTGISLSMTKSNFDQRIELYGVLGMPCGSSSTLSTVTAASQIYLFTGKVVSEGAAGDKFGSSVAVGDIKGDGFADVGVGAVNYNTSTSYKGKIFIFPSVSASGVATTATSYISGTDNNGLMGHSIAISDINADGYADFIAGASSVDFARSNTNAGQVTLYHANSSGLATIPTVNTTLNGTGLNHYFGTCVK